MPIPNGGSENAGQDGQQAAPAVKTQAQLETERAVAITESINNHKAAEAARKEAEAYKQVAKDPNSLLKIHESDPAFANKVSQEVFGKTYDELVAEAEARRNGGKKTGENVDEAVNKALEKRDRETAKRRLTEAEDKFYADAGLVPGSDLYKKIREQYTQYSPANVEAARQILTMLHDNAKKGSANGLDLGTTPPPMSGSSASSGSASSANKKPVPTAAQKAIMPQLKITQAEFEKYAKPRS